MLNVLYACEAMPSKSCGAPIWGKLANGFDFSPLQYESCQVGGGCLGVCIKKFTGFCGDA